MKIWLIFARLSNVLILAQNGKVRFMGKGKFSMAEVLSGRSLGVSQAADQESFVIKSIPLEKIRRSEKNQYGIRDIEELAATIEAMGLMHNILVCETSEPEVYELISGERRYMAYKLLFEAGDKKYSTIPCKVLIQEDEELSELRMLFANSTARELNDYEKTFQAMRIKKLLQDLKVKGHKIDGRLRDIVANVLEVSPAQVGRMEKIYGNLIPSFLEKFKSNEIGITAAYDLAALPQSIQGKIYMESTAIGSEALQKTVGNILQRFTEQKTPDVLPLPGNNQDIQYVSKAPATTGIIASEKRPIDQLKANKAQRNALIDFGKEAVQNLYNAVDMEEKAIAESALKVLSDIAGAFGVNGYDALIRAVPVHTENNGK